ncbi:MAG TPA: hypothetical protein PLC77_05515 [Bacteroidales bacterium]|nr:hypothetical protein [Bacteroidales bacterium]
MRVLLSTGLLFLLCSCNLPDSTVEENHYPPVFPDYMNITIPRTIAPLHFMAKDGSPVKALIAGKRSRLVSSGRCTVRIPAKKWKRMLATEDSLTIRVCIKHNGEWHSYKSFSWTISPDPVDPCLCYRRVAPGYESFGSMGIYQRDLSSFRETAVIENTIITNSCVNCHSFASADPQRFQFHLRGPGGGTLVHSEGELTHIDTKVPGTVSACVYPYWHPSGSHIAYSVNNILQWFHNVPEKVIDVFDTRSDIVIYELKKQAVHIHPVLCDSTVLETFPAFSSDGQTLYYTAAPSRQISHIAVLDSIRYSLYSIPFNPETNTVGSSTERLFPLSDSAALSVSFPRPSPDGRYLMFTGSAYGNFTIWHDDADLWLMDLSTGKTEPAAALNSPDTESYHSWSSSSKWVVFSSRRDDGRYTRLYLAHMNDGGTFDKPFVLPQKDPRSDLNLMQSYNLPEFVKGKISFYPRDIFRAKHIKAKEWKH